jgi:hypothetical protein
LKTNEGDETMKRIQRVLFALAAVAALGLWGANSAFAQVGAGNTQLTTQGGLKTVSAEGETEVVSAVSAQNQGANPGTIVTGTTITISFDGDITNAFGDRDPGAVDAVFSPEDLVVCTGFAPAGTGCDTTDGAGLAELEVSVDGSDLIISFLQNVDFPPGTGLTASGIRMAIPGPGDIGATISSSGDPVGNRVTYSNPLILVARARESLDVEIEPAENPLLLCDPPEMANILEFSATVGEFWGAVFRTDAQEAANGNPAELPMAIDGSQVVFTLSGINAELTVEAEITDEGDSDDGDPDTGLFQLALNSDSEVSDGDDIEFAVSFDATETGANEEFTVTFTVFLDTGDDLDLDISTVNLAVDLGPLGEFDEDDPEILLFRENGTDLDVLDILECTSFLLYQWTPNTGDGAYDTGMVMSNTGNAPDELKTPASQTGLCHVHFYELDGGDEVAVVDTDDLEPGESATMVVSQVLADPFLGYAIAVCEFQWGHGYFFTNSPSPGSGGAFAQGGAATVLSDRSAKAVESQGQ